jgi:hypothetical protein
MAKKNTANPANSDTTDIVVQPAGYTALANIDFAAMVSEELAGLNREFDKIKIPSGGALMFEVPGEDDGPDSVREFSAVILHQHQVNTYYATKYDGSKNPPDCSSLDGIRGTGLPGGFCERCKFAQFGTGENGISKACKNRRRLYVLWEGEVFPMLLSLPTGSLKPFTAYLKALVTKGRFSNYVVTRFSLAKAASKGGIEYSQGVFSIDRVLTTEELALIKPLSADIKTLAAQVGLDTDSDVGKEYSAMYGGIVDPETGEVVEPLGGAY